MVPRFLVVKSICSNAFHGRVHTKTQAYTRHDQQRDMEELSSQGGLPAAVHFVIDPIREPKAREIQDAWIRLRIVAERDESVEQVEEVVPERVVLYGAIRFYSAENGYLPIGEHTVKLRGNCDEYLRYRPFENSFGKEKFTGEAVVILYTEASDCEPLDVKISLIPRIPISDPPTSSFIRIPVPRQAPAPPRHDRNRLIDAQHQNQVGNLADQHPRIPDAAAAPREVLRAADFRRVFSNNLPSNRFPAAGAAQLNESFSTSDDSDDDSLRSHKESPNASRRARLMRRPRRRNPAEAASENEDGTR